MLKGIVLCAMALGAASSQPTVDLTRVTCAGVDPAKPRIVVYTAALPNASGAKYSIISCVEMGPGLQLKDGVLSVAMPPPAIPTMYSETVTVDAPDSFTHRLSRTPAPGTMVIVIYRSKLIGGDTMDFGEPKPPDPRLISIALPLESGSGTPVIKVLYWSLE